jgi:hypothetical protein
MVPEVEQFGAEATAATSDAARQSEVDHDAARWLP